MSQTSVTFPSGEALIELEGILHLPGGHGPFPACVICHPYPPAGGSMEVPVVATVANALAQAGVAALRFNFRGVGASTGAFDDGQGEVDDVVGALDWLSAQSEVNPDRLALVGYSFGAVMALFNAARDDQARPLVLIGIPLRWNLPLPALYHSDCLLLAGEIDQFCPLSELRAFAQQQEGVVKVDVIAGADHFLFGYESEVANAVVGFLRETLSR
jgi:alpha/beta superfamily hydrolase